MLIFILAVGEFWAAMLAARAMQYWHNPNDPLVLFVPVFWLAIHFGIPALFRKEPIW